MPQFSAGAVKTAKITLTNPKAKATSYNGILFMGTNMMLMAETPFSLNPGQSKEVSFSVKMPAVVGTYPVYIGAFSNNVLIPPYYNAREDVVIGYPAGVAILGATATRLPDKGINVSVRWVWSEINWGETGDFAVAGAYFGDASTNVWGVYRETLYHNPPRGVPLEHPISFPWDFLTGMGEHPEEAYKYHDFKVIVQLFRQYWNPTPWHATYIAKGII